MNFPNFNDFLATFKNENANRLSEIVHSQNQPSDLKELAGTIVNVNTTATFEILRLYHQWLAESFEEHQQDNR